MDRPNFRQSPAGMGSRGGFRNSTPNNNNNHGGGGRFPSPGRGGFGGGSSPMSFGPPRPGSFMMSPPHTPPMGFHGGKERSYHHFSSPEHTPRRPSYGGGAPYRNDSNSFHRSPSPGGPRYQSPRPYHNQSRRESSSGVEKYYSPAMLEDPWAHLQPGVASNKQQSSTPRGGGRYW